MQSKISAKLQLHTHRPTSMPCLLDSSQMMNGEEAELAYTIFSAKMWAQGPVPHLLPLSWIRKWGDASLGWLCNSSLTEGVHTTGQKRAIVLPLLWKLGLDPNSVTNYLPISNPTFLSKFLRISEFSEWYVSWKKFLLCRRYTIFR